VTLLWEEGADPHQSPWKVKKPTVTGAFLGDAGIESESFEADGHLMWGHVKMSCAIQNRFDQLLERPVFGRIYIKGLCAMSVRDVNRSARSLKPCSE
jgi:hypothetical protein